MTQQPEVTTSEWIETRTLEWMREEMFALRNKFEKAKKALEAQERYMSGQILKRHEMVRQLDGSIKSELIPTYASEMLDGLRKTLKEIG